MVDFEHDYRVGRDHPPKHTRFRKGQSGNPSGRPKERPNPRAILEKRLLEELPIKGTHEKRPALDVLITQLRNQALAGCKPSISLLRLFVQTFGLPDIPPPEETRVNWAEADRALIEDFRRRSGIMDDDQKTEDGGNDV